MKNLLFIVTFILIFSCDTSTSKYQTLQRNYPKNSFEESTKWADSLINLMTLDEKISLIGGVDIFFTNEIERLGIPRIMMTDATAGIHLRENFMEYTYEKVLERSTSFPCPLMLASAWNTDLAYEYAFSIGEECRAGGIPVLLGPGMNIYRHSQSGRNFEYMGEDPYLVARIIENYVTGVQNTGTIATLKHFVANNTDYFRRKSNSVVDERTLNEIYFPAFKAGIDAGAMSVMTAYNLLNGEYCGQSDYVISKLLRDQLEYRWMTVTDWWSVWDGEKVITSGQDLEMPSSEATKNAKELIEQGSVQEADIDRMVRSLLTTFYAMDAYQIKSDSTLLEKFPEHLNVALNTAREGIVLLKNKQILPLSSEADANILVTGEYLDRLAFGGGSAEVEGYDILLLGDALKAEFGERIQIDTNPNTEKIKEADYILFSAGTSDSEGWDRPFSLPAAQEEKIRRCVENNQNTILIVQSGSGVRMTDWVDKAGAIIYAWYGGQIGNQAVAEVLSGKVNPSGKLPITIERNFEESPGYGYIPEGEDLYTGWPGESELNKEIYDIIYKEEIFVGYRWYEANKIEPLFPFGYGLSYTTFEYADFKISESKFTINDIPEISLKVKNTGNSEGKEIVQLYISDIECSYVRPIKELKGFKKVSLLPGGSVKVDFELSEADFAFWHPEEKKWTTEPGEFKIMIGSSSADIRLKQSIFLE